MDVTPFPIDLEIYRKLYIASDGTLQRQTDDTQLVGGNESREKALPGHPNIFLQDARIGSFLERELVTRRLDTIGSRLWLMAKQDSSHISSLTQQLVRGRRIVITEDPELHLVWIYDQVFIKPLPKYLLSFAFWQFYSGSKTSPIQDPQQREAILRAARGFLRSYSYLIQHKSDFLLAADDKCRLLPKKIRYSEFIRFIAACQQSIQDEDVSPRYSFGELRLSRLNFWSKIFLRQTTFHKVHGQYGARFAQYYGPILFVFGGLSAVLSAMQVALAAKPQLQPNSSSLRLVQVSWGFSICALVVVVLLVLFLLVVFLFLVLRETLYAVKDLVRKRGSRPCLHC